MGDFKTNASHPQAATKTALTTSSTQTQFDAITDYTYDANGNLTLDNNKTISGITYNHLNLPSVITVTGKGTIAYTYDATGNKLKKVVTETGQPVKTTLYIDGAVYENEILQFIGHEEGRIRWKPQNNTFNFDYFLKDHLGNVRMVLTDEQQTDAYPGASMETAQATTEASFYTNLPQSRADKPTGYPNDTYTNPNDKVAKLRGDAQKIGPGIMLKVMAGDKFNLRVSSWYKLNGVTPAAPYNPIGDLVYMLAWSAPGAGSKSTMQELQNSGVLTPGAASFVNTQNGYNISRPKAFVNWVLLDEQFKFVSSSSGSEQVPAESAFGTVPNQVVYPHVRTGLPIDKSGYLYVYVSNETPNIDVFFDNLQVTHVRGPMVEETHYYPWGLTMAGISSKAVSFGNPSNKIKFQGQELASKEFNDGSGLEMYEFKWRMHDLQTGRFWQIDPLSDKYVYNSTYAFSENLVTGHVELEGLEAIRPEQLRDPNFNINSFQNSLGSQSTNPNYQRNARSLPPMTAKEAAALKSTPRESAVRLNISWGKQLGVQVGPVGVEVNEGSTPILQLGSNGTVRVGNQNNETTTGASIRLGPAELSTETVSKSEKVKNNVKGFSIPIVSDKTTETTTNIASIGIAKTPFSVGVQNVQQTQTFTQFGNPTAPTITNNLGNQPFVGLPSFKPLTGTVPGNNGTKISVSVFVKGELSIDFGRILESITN